MTDTTKNLTVVTGLWNIGREDRNFQQYIDNFKKFLTIPVKMFIYVPKELEYLVWEVRDRVDTHVRLFELNDVKTLYAPFWEQTQNIRTNEKWQNQTGEHGWLKNSPQAKLEWYNPIVQSKMFMLHDAKVMNLFNTDYFLWLDAGITNTVYEKYFTDNRCLDKIIPHLDTFLFLSYPYEANTEIHGFDYSAMNRYAKQKVEYVCRGGLFGGHKDIISRANESYYHLLSQTLNEGLMGTEESIFTLMAYLSPQTYKRYVLDSNGLIVKFTQALLDDSVSLVFTPKAKSQAQTYTKTDKTSLYILSFNFPEQFKRTLESLSLHSGFLDRTRKILINNSSNNDVIEQYDSICKEFGFEHIVRGENFGINRGRQYVAEHFDASDSEYYFFFEDDMMMHLPTSTGTCRNGFQLYVPDLFDKVHGIMARENFDFLKLSFTEVYMDNYIQVSWYNVPQRVRTDVWPHYDQLPVGGLDANAPRTKFDTIGSLNGLSYISGQIYYANWPMIVSRAGNKRMFLDTKWHNPYEQTWMSHMFQETLKGNLKPAVLLASPINHNRIFHYSGEERREN